MTIMRPPHLGQSQIGLGCWAGEAAGSVCEGCAAPSSLKAKRQKSGAPAVGEEAKVANADKAFGKHMQEEVA
jgi:hypothetical protein